MMLFATLLLTVGCTSKLEEPSSDYGYLQFKLYKNNLPEVKAGDNTELESMYSAKRMRITLNYEKTTITQSVDLNAYDDSAAEWGLYSEKVQLLAGNYQVQSVELLDERDNSIYTKSYNEEKVTVISSELTIKELVVKSKARGYIRILFGKSNADTRSSNLDNDGLMFNTVKTATVVLTNSKTMVKSTYNNLKLKYRSNISDDLYISDYLVCDSLLKLDAGDWFVSNYTLKSNSNTVLGSGNFSLEDGQRFTMGDNDISDLVVNVELNLESEAIKDYRALKEIWEALDGENWSYVGQGEELGTNWNFDRDINMWGNQPCVQLHGNGRVASIDFSGFGVNGDMPDAIGQLTELRELYIGTHNDIPRDDFEISKRMRARSSIYENSLNAERMNNASAYYTKLHGNISQSAISPLLSQAYTLSGKQLPGGMNVTQEDIDYAIKNKNQYRSIAPTADTHYGEIYNGVRSLPATINKLKRLQLIFIANSAIETIPDELGELKELTDLEIYNCPFLKKFPSQVIANLDMLVSLNISQNKQWSSEEIFTGLKNMCEDESISQTLQILYCNGTNLEEVPVELNNLKALGLIDFSFNKIKTVHSMTDLKPVKFSIDNNKIEEFPEPFVNLVDCEDFTASNNKLTKFPNIFNAKSYKIKNVVLNNNLISSISDKSEFKGVNVEILNLKNNKFTAYPSAFSTSASLISMINLSANEISSFEENSFVGENTHILESIDLSWNNIDKLSKEMNANNLPYLTGFDLSYNRMEKFAWEVLNSSSLTILVFRGQRDKDGNRCMSEWPNGIGEHAGLRGLYVGSNDLGVIEDTISFLIFHLEISDNPNIVFDASDICYYISQGVYNFHYDLTQDIRNCSILGIE